MNVLVRIDDRLIHGQVVEGWVHYLKATCLIVADDAVAANDMQRTIMEMAVPMGMKVIIGRVETICQTLKTAGLDRDRAILLFSRPADVLRALRAGMECGKVNVGGMHYMPGKRKLIDILSVNDDDMDAFREMVSSGVQIAVQSVPTQKPVPLESILQSCSENRYSDA